DRPQPGDRRADPRPDDRVLRDRGVADPLLAKLVEEPLGDLERALEDADVLAHHEHRLVAAHLLRHRVAEGLPHPLNHRPAASSSPPPGAAGFDSTSSSASPSRSSTASPSSRSAVSSPRRRPAAAAG